MHLILADQRQAISICSILYFPVFAAVRRWWDATGMSMWENLKLLANYIPYLRIPNRSDDQLLSSDTTDMDCGSER